MSQFVVDLIIFPIDPFVDERDPFTETEKVDPAIDVPDSEDPSKKTEKAGPAIDASHPRAPGGSKVPSRKGEKAGPTIEASHPRAPGGSEVPFTETEKADPSIDASHSRAPVSSEVPFTDVGPALDAKAPLEDDDDLGSLDPFHYEDPLAETADVGSTLDDIHIRIQQRNGRKTLTTLQGLPKESMSFIVFVLLISSNNDPDS